MLSIVYPVACGNALRIISQPPAGTARLRLLRKDADTFSGPDDAWAILVYEGIERSILDAAGLVNDVEVFYRAYYLIGSVWVASATKSGIPSATFTDRSVDVLSLVRDRLDLGLSVYVARGELIHDNGHIQVMTASPLVEEAPLPIVTVHLASDASSERFIGEHVANDEYDEVAEVWRSVEGWFSRAQLTVIAWCTNADERIVLRKALKSVLMSNLPVFDAAGLMQIDLQFSDQEDFTSYAAPIYQAICNFTCYAPSGVDATDVPVRDVVSTLTV